jgi:hypothetical protein
VEAQQQQRFNWGQVHMADSDKIIRLLRHLLKTPLPSRAIAKLIFPTNEDFCPQDHLTHVEQRFESHLLKYYVDKLSYGSSRDSRVIHSLTSTDGREAHIHNRLGHISVNPNDPFNTACLIQTYRFVESDPLSTDLVAQQKVLIGEAETAFDEEAQDICVNKNFAATKAFVDTLIRIADEQDKLLNTEVDRQDRSLMQQRALLLHAQRGAGKTFYENYVLSRFSNYFDRHNTIWVRINLVEDIGFDAKLLDWINAQTAKIIMRYYDPLSLYFPKSRARRVDVQKYLERNLFARKSRSVNRILRQQFARACTIFREGGHKNSAIREEPISETLIPAEIAIQVVGAARADGFKFIVVLDGLDILEITKSYRARFNLLTQQCMELAKNAKRNGFALLVVTRTNTLNNVLRADYHSTFEQADFEQYVVEPVPLAKIIDVRLKYIIAETAIMHKAKVVSWSVDDVERHIDEYKEFLEVPENVYGSKTSEKFISILENIQGSNNRAKVQMLQYRYYDFFARRRIVKGGYHAYQLVESLMKAGRRFPPIPYGYSTVGSEQLRTTWHTQRYDTRFFPSIFRFPFTSEYRQRGRQRVLFDGSLGKPRLENVMLGLRILQLLEAHDAFNIKMDKVVGGEVISNKVTVGEFAQVLLTYFDYEEGLTYRMIDEFVEYQLIEYRHPNITVASNRQEDNEILILPKLRFLLNRFLYDLAYLNMAAIRVPLPSAAFENVVRPYFHAISYEEPSDGLGRWVAGKFTNAVGLIRLLKHLNSRQEPEVKSRILQNEHSDREWCAILKLADERGLFYFVDEIAKNVLHEAELALSGILLPIMVSYIEEYVRNYCLTWDNDRVA